MYADRQLSTVRRSNANQEGHFVDDTTRESQQKNDEGRQEYVAPKVVDYGSLQELTARHTSSGSTDVPRGSPGPQVFS